MLEPEHVDSIELIPIELIPDLLLLDDCGNMRITVLGTTAVSQRIGEPRPEVQVDRFDAVTRIETTFKGLLLGIPISDEFGEIQPFAPSSRMVPLAFEVEDEVLGFIVRIERPHNKHPY